ncbi:MAG: RNA pyrophosphohydrolase [Caulobacteraceae bacterium]|nr:RNA pyrophosphohydrolase [Caulobacteraceae bacterium]
MAERDLALYRPNVGVVLANRDGQVWIGRRAGTPGPHNWQFPQGGVDPGEDPRTAAFRELKEETGAVSATVLARTEEWIAYDFPVGHRRRKGERWLGQKQLWFALRFTGDDREFDLAAHHEIEFDAWRWADPAEALDGVVSFKRETYRHVLTTFAAALKPERQG